jgi:[ribosomal protein S5]-alanine N-acetyltransferase
VRDGLFTFREGMSVKLVGERVVVREFTVDDVDAMYAYLSDEEAFLHVSWEPQTLDELRESVREEIEAARTVPRLAYELAVTLRDTGEVVGQVTLKMDTYIPQIRQRTAELGYMMRRDCWGRGLATEAARLVLDFAFGELGLHRVFAVVDDDHAASIRVLEKLGLRREARHAKDSFVRGEWLTTLIYAVLEEEWPMRPSSYDPS